MKASVVMPRKRKAWTAEERRVLRNTYPDNPTAHVARVLGRPERAVYFMAWVLGLRKSDAYLDSAAACRLKPGANAGVSSRFQKGQIPWNKGIHFDSGGRSVETRFRPGSVPVNHKSVGTIRTNIEGYLEIKVAEGTHQWRLLHREIWKEAHGEYPAKGTTVFFKDGNRKNCVLANLETVTRAELMLRNTVHNLPEEIREVIHLNGVLRRKINGK